MASADDDLRSWDCTLTYPEGWIEVTFGAAQDPTGASQLTDDVLARMLGGADRDRAALVELVAAVLDDDAARGAVLGAHRYFLDPELGHVHGHLTMWLVERQHPESLDDELAVLVERAQRPMAAFEEPEVGEVELPQAGLAVRARFLEMEPFGDEEPVEDAPHDRPDGDGGQHDPGTRDGDAGHPDDIEAVLVDTVSYLVPVEGADCCLWLRFWTPHLAAAERLVGEFDTIAESLLVRTGGRPPT